MIIELLKKMDGFTNSEKAIAQFILDNPSKFQNLTSEELANKTYTSRATVIRLCKKLSTSGYREFQRMIISDLNEIKKRGSGYRYFFNGK